MEYDYEYVNYQKRLREIIVDLTLENALEIGLNDRQYFRLKAKLKSSNQIVIRKKTLEKLVNNGLTEN